MDKTELNKLARKLKFRLDQDVLEKLESDFHVIENRIKEMQSIDTKDVPPLVRVNEEPIKLFRDDVVEKTMSVYDVLSNAASVDNKNNLIVVKKVVKDV